MTIFATIVGALPTRDIVDICDELLRRRLRDASSESRLVVVTELVPDKDELQKLPLDRLALFQCSLPDSNNLFAALAYVSGSAAHVKLLINEVGDELPTARPLADSLNFVRIENLIDSGQSAFAGKLASSTRRNLPPHGSVLNAALADSLKRVALLCDLLETLRAPSFSEPGGTLARRGYDTDLFQMVSANNSAIQLFEKATPEAARWLSHTKEFFKAGSGLADAAFRRPAPRYELFVWLTSFFLQSAKVRMGRGEVSEALQLAVRALEAYCLYHLATTRDIELDDGVFIWTKNGNRPSGVGELFSELRNQNKIKSLPLSKDLLDVCTEAIHLRNRSIFGHGVQTLKESEATKYISGIRRLIAGIEDCEDSSRTRWAILNRSSVFTVNGVLKPLVRQALESSLVVGEI